MKWRKAENNLLFPRKSSASPLARCLVCLSICLLVCFSNGIKVDDLMTQIVTFMLIAIGA